MRYITNCGRASYKLPPELQLALKTEAARRQVAGQKVPAPNWMRDPEASHVLAEYLARIFRMPQEERDRLASEGRAALDEILASDTMVRLVEDRPFCAPAPEPSVVEGEKPAVGARPKRVKGHPGREHPGQDRGQGEHDAPAADKAPGRRA